MALLLASSLRALSIRAAIPKEQNPLFEKGLVELISEFYYS